MKPAQETHCPTDSTRWLNGPGTGFGAGLKYLVECYRDGLGLGLLAVGSLAMRASGREVPIIC